jgi:hypothetical protein
MSRSSYNRNVIIASVIALAILGGLLWLGSNRSSQSDLDWGEVSFGSATSSLAALNLWQTYQSESHHFSFKYPPGFTVGSFRDGKGEAVVVQNVVAKQGFQVYITPIDEDIQITQERIKTDIPGWKVLDPQPVLLGVNDTDGRGLAFKSENPTFGQSREVWFTYGGYLYQVSTYLVLDSLLQQVMNTWVFE